MGAMSFLTWVESILPGSAERHGAEVDAQAEREAGVVRTPETYWGTDQAVTDPQTGEAINPATGRPYDRATGGTERHDASGWNWLDATWRRVTGQTTTTSGVDDTTGQAVTVTDTERAGVTVDPSRQAVTASSTSGTTSQVLDVPAMVATARRDLQARIDDPGTAEADRTRLRADLARLQGDAVDEATLREVVRSSQLQLRPAYRASTGETTTTTGTVARQGVGASVTGSSATATTDASGATSTTTLSGGASADAYAGTARVTGAYSTADRAADGSSTTTDTVSATGTLSASRGQLTATGSRTVSTQTTDASGRVQEGGADTQSRSVGLIAGDQGTGVALGRGSDQSTTVDGVTGRTQTQTSARVTDRGVGASTSTDRSLTGRDYTGSVKTSADGSFTVNITPVRGSVPPQFQVVMQLSASAGLAGSVGTAPPVGAAAQQMRTSGSVRAGATGSAQLTFTHVMDEAEARQYMADVDAADQGGGAARQPEFGVISRLRALANEDGAGAGAVAVLGSSQGAAMLGDGESIELTLAGDVNVGGTVGRSSPTQGGSIGGSASAGATRSIRIERTGEADAHGHHLVDVTVTFATRTGLGANGSVTAEGVTVGGTYSQADSHSEGATVRLDTDAPDYADKYQQVCAALTVDEVRALATRFTQGQSSSSGGTVSVGALGVTADVGVTSRSSEQVTRDVGEGQLTGTVSGGQTVSGGIAVGSGDTAVRGLQQSQTDTATTTVDSGGSETTLSRETASSDPLRAVREGWDAVTGWFGAEHTAAERAAAVTQSPQERLRAQLQTTYAELETYQISESDLHQVVARAGDAREWDRMNNSPRLIEPWRGFRASLVSPTVDPAEQAINAEDAMRLARGRVMAAWLSARGSEGLDLVVAVLRYWQQHGLSVESAQDLGTHFEWPNSLTAQRTRYDSMHARVRTADETLGRMVGTRDGLSRGRAWYDDTRTQLGQVEAAVRGSTEVQPRAKLEMIDRIQHEVTDLDGAWTRNQHALESGVAESAAPAASGEALTSHADPLQSVDPAVAAQTPEQAAARRRMGEVLSQLTQYKHEEQAAFTRARGMMPTRLHGTIEGTWSEIWNGDFSGAQGVLGGVADSHETWIARIHELRTIYGTLQTPQDQWAVSTGPGAPRNPTNEPDMDTLYTLYAQTDDSVGFNFTMPERRQIADGWRARWRRY